MAFFKIPKAFKNKYEKRELEYFKKENRNKKVGEIELLREGERIAFGIPAYEHKVGSIVKYDNKYMVVKEVRKDGVLLQPVNREDLLDNPIEKPIFVKERKYEKKAVIKPNYVLT